jgi:hypothetical protein
METDDQMLTAAQVKRGYGNCSDMKIHRWLKKKVLDFPEPILIDGRRYWRLSDLQHFDSVCIARQTGLIGGR